MMVVGLTGGVGSGKSAAAECFAALDVPIIDADIAARAVVRPDSPALAQIAAHFGAGMLTPQGELDRRQLRERIFGDSGQRLWLERLLHPLILSAMRRELDALRRAGGHPYALLCSPLLFEAGQHAATQRVVVVDTPEAEQIQRVTRRDKTSAAQVAAIQRAQLSRHARLQRADDILDNSGDERQLAGQIQQLHARYLRMCNGR